MEQFLSQTPNNCIGVVNYLAPVVWDGNEVNPLKYGGENVQGNLLSFHENGANIYIEFFKNNFLSLSADVSIK